MKTIVGDETIPIATMSNDKIQEYIAVDSDQNKHVEIKIKPHIIHLCSMGIRFDWKFNKNLFKLTTIFRRKLNSHLNTNGFVWWSNVIFFGAGTFAYGFGIIVDLLYNSELL